MSYTTLEAHIDHGKVLVKEPEKLPDSARALLTILESSIHESNGMSPMEALETLQKHLKLDERKVTEWMSTIHQARR